MFDYKHYTENNRLYSLLITLFYAKCLKLVSSVIYRILADIKKYIRHGNQKL